MINLAMKMGRVNILLRQMVFAVVAICYFSFTANAQYNEVYANDSIAKNYQFIFYSSEGKLDSVRKAIHSGINIDFRDANGATALFYAVNNNYLDLVKELMYYGANPNISTYEKFSPLMAAASNGSFDIAEVLLRYKRTKINLADQYNLTALHYAAYYNNLAIVDMLLFYGANAQIIDVEGNSPLLLASYNSDTALASELIEAGNSILQTNQQHYSPLSIAIQTNDSLLCDLYFNKIKASKIPFKELQSMLNFAISQRNSYAAEKILSLVNSNDLKNNAVPMEVAYKSQDRTIIKLLRNEGFKNYNKLIINDVHLKYSTSFNPRDYTGFFALGVNEARYKVSLDMLYGTRFTHFSVLQKQNNTVYYQLWERVHIFGFQLRKNFIAYIAPKVIIKPYAALGMQWRSIRYDGMSAKINNEFHLVPELGISMNYRWWSVDLSYQYANNHIISISPHRLNIGLGVRFPFFQPKNYIPQCF